MSAVFSCGCRVILWLAGLAALPKEVEEAAQVDGANRWQSWHYIIRPGAFRQLFYDRNAFRVADF
ncbi:MAG: hypothetical protein K1W31_03815 [Lachnospiraceae bacterium]